MVAEQSLTCFQNNQIFIAEAFSKGIFFYFDQIFSVNHLIISYDNWVVWRVVALVAEGFLLVVGKVVVLNETTFP